MQWACPQRQSICDLPNEEHAGAQAAADQPGQLRGCGAGAPVNLWDTANAAASQPGSARAQSQPWGHSCGILDANEGSPGEGSSEDAAFSCNLKAHFRLSHARTADHNLASPSNVKGLLRVLAVRRFLRAAVTLSLLPPPHLTRASGRPGRPSNLPGASGHCCYERRAWARTRLGAGRGRWDEPRGRSGRCLSVCVSSVASEWSAVRGAAGGGGTESAIESAQQENLLLLGKQRTLFVANHQI